MEYLNEKKRSQWNYIFSGMTVALIMVVIGVCFDYYYRLNDDMTIRDILSGSYTGSPDGHNIQMMYPLSLLISLLYRAVPGLPWFGYFLCLCHYGCLFLICLRASCCVETNWKKLGVTLLAGFFSFSVLVYELIYIQYTMTSAILIATGTFWFYTSDYTKGIGRYLAQNSISILLVVLAFEVRFEMALLLTPLLLAAGMCKWGKEKKIFTLYNCVKYFSVIGIALLGVGAGLLADRAAYGSGDWKEFMEFFDQRTAVYDFMGIPPYEENKAFYESIGLAKEEQELLENYNFALDEGITKDTLEQVASYQEEKNGGNSLALISPGDAVWIYKHNFFSAEYAPYNYLILLLYALILFAAACKRDIRYVWKLPLLFGIRTVCWMYIILRNRTPERITHGLYLMELLLLTAILMEEWRRERKSRITVAAVLCVIVAMTVPMTVSKVIDEKNHREEVNKEWEELKDYCRDRKDNFYFIDVYSSVSYSEKLFQNVDHSLQNSDLCGGWTIHSPVHAEKLSRFGIVSVQEALAGFKHVFFVSKVNRPVDWLDAYFQEKGTAVKAEAVDSIEVEGEVRFVIYQMLCYTTDNQ